MRVGGILEPAPHVADLARSAGSYRRPFGFGTLLESERLVAVGVAGRNVLPLFPRGGTAEPLATSGGVIPPHGGSGHVHLAFSIAAADLGGWRSHLGADGVPVESEVTRPGGATSPDFRDPDRHLVELIAPGFWAIY